MNGTKILIVDDEPLITKTVQAYLKRRLRGAGAADGASALKMAMPSSQPGGARHHAARMDGLEVLRRLRQESEVYVLMLTARADETTRSWASLWAR